MDFTSLDRSWFEDAVFNRTFNCTALSFSLSFLKDFSISVCFGKRL